MDTTYTAYYWVGAVAIVALVVVGAYLYTGGSFTNFFGSASANSAQVTASVTE